MSAGPDFRPSPDLYPFESRWHESSKAGRMHYVDEGDGQPILMLHGNPTWSFLYRRVISGLRDRFRCVAVDYPGFGLSDRPTDYGYTAEEHAQVIGALVDSLQLSEFILMGQDWGGPIGLRIAADRADRVHGLVLGNTWFWPMTATNGKIFSRVMSSPPLQWAILRRNFFVERLMPAGTSTKLPDEVMWHYRGVQPTPAARAGVAEYPRQILAAAPFLAQLERDVRARLGDKRVLLVWGMKDPAFPPKPVLGKMRTYFADHEVVELARAKHFIQEDAPEKIAAAIARRFS